MVSLTNGNECSNNMIFGRVLVVEGSLPEPMSERIDAKGRLNSVGQLRKEG